MPRITRGNVVLHVSEEEVPHYLRLGYNVTTPMGKVTQSAIPQDIATLQAHYVRNTEKIQMLEAQIAALTAENEMLKAAAKPKRQSTKAN
mgnify:CR=1 FL=1